AGHGPDPGYAVRPVREALDDGRDRSQVELVQAVDDDAAADPQHGGRADTGQGAEDRRHGLDQAASEALGGAVAALGHVQTDVVHLHDEADDAIDADGDRQGHGGEGGGLHRQRQVGDLGQGDGHDLAREDEIRADGAADLLLLQVGRTERQLG